MRKMNIVKSKTSPSKSDLWLTYDENELPVIKKWGSSGWETITGDTSGATAEDIENLKEQINLLKDMAPEDLDTLKEIADRITTIQNSIPTKTSELLNDSTYVTQSELNSEIEDCVHSETVIGSVPDVDKMFIYDVPNDDKEYIRSNGEWKSVEDSSLLAAIGAADKLAEQEEKLSELDSKVGKLDEDVNGKHVEDEIIISISGAEYRGKYATFPNNLKEGDELVARANVLFASWTRIGFTKNQSSFVAGDCITLIQRNAIGEYEVRSSAPNPNEYPYIYIQKGGASNTSTLELVKNGYEINGVKQDIDNIADDIKEANERIDENADNHIKITGKRIDIDYSKFPLGDGYLGASGVWYNLTINSYKHIVVPAEKIDYVTIKSPLSSTTDIGFLAEYKTPVENDSAIFCEGCHLNTIKANTELRYEIPNDCKYIYIRMGNSIPQYVYITRYGLLNGLDERISAIEKRNSVSPIISFVDDDCNIRALNFLEKVVDACGLPITCALYTQPVGKGNENYTTWEHLRRLRGKGFTFVSHTNEPDGMTNYTDEEVDESLNISQSLMEEHGMLDTQFLIYPQGKINRTDGTSVLPIVQKYHKYGFMTNAVDSDEDGNFDPNNQNIIKAITNRYQIRRANLDNLNWNRLKNYIDAVKGAPYMVIFYGHAYHAEYTEEQVSNYIDFVQYCKANGCRVLNLPDAIKEFSNLLNNSESLA